MLRPMDIVSLARATNFNLRPSRLEMKYMEWWRQIFHDTGWVEQNESRITIIGKDLIRLKNAIARWDYFDATEIKLLVVVQETLPRDGRREARSALLTSIDTSYMAGINQRQIYHFHIVQTIIIFYEGGEFHNNWCIDSAFRSSKSLLEPIDPIAPVYREGARWYPNTDGTFSPLRHVAWNDTPLGVADRAVFPLNDPWYKAWYARLSLPGFIIESTVTHADYTIYAYPRFYYFPAGNMRITLLEDCSIIVPTISPFYLSQYPETRRFYPRRGPQGLVW
jgi:hypothetical protein